MVIGGRFLTVRELLFLLSSIHLRQTWIMQKRIWYDAKCSTGHYCVLWRTSVRQWFLLWLSNYAKVNIARQATNFNLALLSKLLRAWAWESGNAISLEASSTDCNHRSIEIKCFFQVYNEILWLLANYCVAVANKQAFIHDKKSKELVTLFCFRPFYPT